MNVAHSQEFERTIVGCEKFAEDRSGGESGLPVRGVVDSFGVAEVA